MCEYLHLGLNKQSDSKISELVVASKSKRAKYFGGALNALCELMCAYGLARETAERQFKIALENGYAAASLRPIRDDGALSSMADLCRRWYIEKSWVDKLGNPKALTWNGRSGSLLKLAQQVNGKKNAKTVIVSLIKHKHIRRNRSGGWLPKAQVVSPSGLDAAQVLRAATMFERLLRTVAYNSERSYRGDVLLEVMAQVPRLPMREIRSFKKFAKAQGLIFAMSVDDWLEARNIPRDKIKNNATRQAGVVAFAFEQPSLKPRVED